MKLTRRQETFILCLLDLFREYKRPIHYSTLAERVGVSPFTAYDMLRLLEEKGFVTSEYRIEPGKSTVGRSEIVFLPTQLTYNRFAELANGTDPDDWEIAKSQILKRILAGGIHDRELADELIARIPTDEPETVRYCFEVIALLFLRLGKNSGRKVLIERMPQILAWKESFSKSGLIILGGFILGLLATDNPLILEADQPIFEYVQRYQSLVSEMEPRLANHLASTIYDMFSSVLKA
ncbi:MAG TPA: helix-turn-helix domain-containing protein [Anaerolineaceae bacterium]|jgi:DNA-binding PadR family transcriptional regulator|nr:helix-turn-helix domain-containing protein [Anaerolineaceae bacterium]